MRDAGFDEVVELKFGLPPLSKYICLQAVVRGFLTRRRIRHQFLEQFKQQIVDCRLNDGDSQAAEVTGAASDTTSNRQQFLKAEDAFRNFQRLLFIFNPSKDEEHFEQMCRYIISSLLQTNVQKEDKRLAY